MQTTRLLLARLDAYSDTTMEVKVVSAFPAQRESDSQAIVEGVSHALHKTRISNALHAMRRCVARLDLDGARQAERLMNDELDLFAHRLRQRPSAR